MDLSIIILNYKQKGLVKQCLKGIISSQITLNYEVIVIDNNSEDGCLEMVQKDFLQPKLEAKTILQKSLFSEQKLPPIKTIQSKKNLGFAAGNNLGIKIAGGKYLVILNPDIAVVSKGLEQIFEFMENHPQVGICGPKLINPDGSVQYSCRRFPGWLMPLYRRTFWGKLPFTKKVINNYLMADWDHNSNREVDWLFGACLVLRKSVLDKIGLFDERFFMYFEDLDLCRRIWQADFKIYYLAEVEMVHYHQRLSAERGGVLGLLFNRAARIHLASGFKYFLKYWGQGKPR